MAVFAFVMPSHYITVAFHCVLITPEKKKEIYHCIIFQRTKVLEGIPKVNQEQNIESGILNIHQ